MRSGSSNSDKEADEPTLLSRQKSKAQEVKPEGSLQEERQIQILIGWRDIPPRISIFSYRAMAVGRPETPVSHVFPTSFNEEKCTKGEPLTRSLLKTEPSANELWETKRSMEVSRRPNPSTVNLQKVRGSKSDWTPGRKVAPRSRWMAGGLCYVMGFSKSMSQRI